MSAIRSIFVVVISLCATIAYGNDFSKSLSQFQVDESALKKMTEQLKQGELIKNPEVEKMLKPMRELINSPEWKEQLTTQMAQLNKVFGHESKSESDEEAGVTNLGQDRPVLFVSSSMPMLTLRNYAHSLAKVGGVMVIRGGVNGLHGLKDSMRFTADILKVNESCTQNCKMKHTAVLIDPILFRRNNIKKVPALIYQHNLNIESHCTDTGNESAEKDIVYGDASLKAMLTELYQLSGEKAIQNIAYKL